MSAYLEMIPLEEIQDPPQFPHHPRADNHHSWAGHQASSRVAAENGWFEEEFPKKPERIVLEVSWSKYVEMSQAASTLHHQFQAPGMEGLFHLFRQILEYHIGDGVLLDFQIGLLLHSALPLVSGFSICLVLQCAD